MPAQNATVTAKYNRTYTLTVATDPVNSTLLAGITKSPSGVLLSGTTVTLTVATIPTDYRFSGWTLPAGVTLASGSLTSTTISFKMPAQNATVTAKYYVHSPGEVLIGNLYWAGTNVGPSGSFAATGTYGQLFQWGENTQYSAVPEGSAEAVKPSNWDTNTPTSWSSNPCPAGWRLPTETELQIFNGKMTMGVSGSITGGYYAGTSLFFPATGFRDAGGIARRYGLGGYYWSSSTASSGGVYRLAFDKDNAGNTGNDLPKSYAFSVRCVRPK
jgi:uncharacterized protein (TIGR02145 family)